MANTIRELIKIDLTQPIEEVIKLGQQDERVVYSELTEYVATDSIRDYYRRLLKEIADSKQEPQEGIGVWISGFFGSGKSSFAKNLGYALANRTVQGKSSAALFNQRMDDQRIAEYLDFINRSIPMEVVMFDVSVDRSTLNQSERLAEVMYRVLLRELDYAEDWTIANLEMTLEADGRLGNFIERFEKKYKSQFGDRQGTWKMRRKLTTRHSEASAILHEIDSSTYPRPDSWAQSPTAQTADISVRKLVEDTFELISRRRPGTAAAFIIDEVGQYVARSADKILDLQAIVRTFGEIGRNKVVNNQAVAPVWIIVTAQEKLDEVVAAIDSKRVELAKLQDSFKYHVDMAPADIRQVASRRVLTKTNQGEKTLRELFRKVKGQLNTNCHLERTTRDSQVDEEEFVQFYPYLPHYIDLSIQIMSGIRLLPGAAKHIGGANRTIIKQAYEMLINDRTNMAEQRVGSLVTLDRIYELVEGNLSSERRADISEIIKTFGAKSWEVRVAKAVCLLEFVRDLPRSEANIAALLVDRADTPSPIEQVKLALEKLVKGQFLRQAEEGYKLQTAQEKNWQTERQSLEPRPRDENELRREILVDVFNDARLKTYRYEDLRTFRIGIVVNDVAAGEEGQIDINLFVGEDEDDFNRYCDELDTRSRMPGNENQLYWAVPLSKEVNDLVVELYRSREMIRKYNQLSAGSTLTDNEKSLLNDEKTEEGRIKGRLREKMSETVFQGVGYFRGVRKEGVSLGKNSIESMRNYLSYTVPQLYTKLKLGARPLKGNEAEDVLKAANLTALPQVFYGGEGGTDLIIERGGRFIPNHDAEIAREVLGYVQRQYSYGNKVLGKELEQFFQNIPYGWDYEMILLVLAVLLRAGSVEITYQGRRFRNHLDPQVRVPFNAKSKQGFRSASFAPRQAIELRTLTEAVRHFEELTGSEVDVEESAIADAFKKLAFDELALLAPLDATIRANHLPAVEIIDEYRTTFQTVLNSASDDCVRILAGEGKSLKELRDKIHSLKRATEEKGLDTLRWARSVTTAMWPDIQSRIPVDGQFEKIANDLSSDLDSNEFYNRLSEIQINAKTIEKEYRKYYEDLHVRRGDAYQTILDDIAGLDVWQQLPPDVRTREMTVISKRADTDLDLPFRKSYCSRCNATISQMESDLAAAGNLRAQIIEKLTALATPEIQIRRVRASDFFAQELADESSIDDALAKLKEYLMDLVKQGIKIILE